MNVMSADKITKVSDMYNTASCIYKKSVMISRSSLFLMLEARIGVFLIARASSVDSSVFAPFLLIASVSVAINAAYLENRDIGHVELEQRYDYFIRKYSGESAHITTEVTEDLYDLVNLTERHIWKHVIVATVNSITIVLASALLLTIISGTSF